MTGKTRAIQLLYAAAFIFIALGLAGCGQRPSEPTATVTPSPTVTARPEQPSATSPPSPTPTSRERAESLATLQAQSTALPCTAEEVIAYSDQVLPLANEHIEAANQARALQPWQQDMPEFESGYVAATERLDQLEEVLAPACAEKAQLKFTSGFELLVDVWDHLGEGEFDLGQRKLASSCDEISQATELLAELQKATQP